MKFSETQGNFSHEKEARALLYPLLANSDLGTVYFGFDKILRFVYIAAPKIARSTVLQIFHRLYFGGNVDTSIKHFDRADALHTEEFKQKFKQHSSLRYLQEGVLEDRELCHQLLFEPAWFRFAIKRNPYQRLFSAWKDKAFYNHYHEFTNLREYRKRMRHGVVEFEDFVDLVVTGKLCDDHVRPVYHPCFSLFPNLHWYDITELDSWLDDFKKHLKHLPQAASLTLPYENLSMPIGKADQFYSQSIADKVYAYYQKDFEFFGYDKDSWYQDQPHSIPLKRGTDVLDDWFMQKLLQRSILREKLAAAEWMALRAQHAGISELFNAVRRKLFSSRLFS